MAFNEAGVRDAGDPGEPAERAGADVPSMRPAYETPEISALTALTASTRVLQ